MAHEIEPAICCSVGCRIRIMMLDQIFDGVCLLLVSVVWASMKDKIAYWF